LILSVLAHGPGANAADPVDPASNRSWPQDGTPYVRPIVPEDTIAVERGAMAGAMPEAMAAWVRNLLIVDVVVNNTNPTLALTDTFNDGETSIAVNPQNPNDIVITAFSGAWGANAPLWHSTDGGLTWTKQFTIPAPPGVPAAGCPCDQTIDYSVADQLAGTFLAGSNFPGPSPTAAVFDVYSGTTTDPAEATAWNWLVIDGVTQQTNNNVPSSFGDADQPWLIVNRAPTSDGSGNIALASVGRADSDQEKHSVYVAYDNFGAIVGNLVSLQVAVAEATTPPDFAVDVTTGFGGGGGTNPGHRLVNDPRTGTIYSLFQQATLVGPDGVRNVNYFLNRSTDGGRTWSLNGNRFGIVVTNADSIQPTPKFCTVNALLGGIAHAAVDPKTGDVYYAYGNRDAATGNQRLAMRRLTTDAAGLVTIGPEFFVTGQVQAALPAVAVTRNGTVGVFYYTCEGFSSDGYPTFTAHVSLSDDQGQSFTDLELLTFLSSAGPTPDARQRVLGDYMQMKALGNTFYGAFTGNGFPFGRLFANHDPIFFRMSVGPRLEESAQ
jgi:hypothetical protein